MASYTYEFIELGDEHSLGCKCCRFSSGTDLPVPQKLSHAEIAHLARAFSAQIFKDWTRLNAILKRYEEVIQKRWMKKSDRKRLAVLLEAWPDMAATHRPDFVGLRKSSKNYARSRTCPSAAYLWPYINQEDLVQRQMLLLFIHSRGRHLPEKFVVADIEAAHLGNGWDLRDGRDEERSGGSILSEPHDSKDVAAVQFQGHRSPGSYGKLVYFDGSEPLQTKQRMALHAPGLGLLGLEIQSGIYRFVLKSALLILHDIEPSQFFLAPTLPMPKMPQPPSSEWPSLSEQALEAPYRVPQMLDLERIKFLVEARRAAAEDHLWLLRTDPGYFMETLKDWKEHDVVTVQHTCGRCTKLVASRMIADAFTYFFTWSHIIQLLNLLPPIKDQIRRADHFSLRLPKKEEAIWAELLEVLDFVIFHPIFSLRTGVPPSPRLRHCYNLPKNPTAASSGERWQPKMKVAEHERRVMELFFSVVDPEKSALHSLNHLVQELQYMLDTDMPASQLVDPWVVSQFSDLALMSELKRRIEGLQPWHTSWKVNQVHKSATVQRNITGFMRLIEVDIHDCLIMLSDEFGFELLNGSLYGSLDYPATKAYTKENVKQMRSAERTLDAFWKILDADLRELSDGTMPILMSMSMQLFGPRKLRTPPYKAPVTPVQTTKPVLQPLSTNSYIPVPHFGATPTSGVVLPKPKSKVKTRGTPTSPTAPEPHPDPATPPAANDDPEPESTPTTPQTLVSKRAFKVLNALLPAPDSSSHQHAEVAWDELLRALNEIGLQPEKLYGSVWVFKPREDGQGMKVAVGRCISFHEPKEVRRGHKVPRCMVRCFGRRLKHAFGWWGGMFGCE